MFHVKHGIIKQLFHVKHFLLCKLSKKKIKIKIKHCLRIKNFNLLVKSALYNKYALGKSFKFIVFKHLDNILIFYCSSFLLSVCFNLFVRQNGFIFSQEKIFLILCESVKMTIFKLVFFFLLLNYLLLFYLFEL